MATTITSVSPTSAPTTGGVLIDVYGTGFVSAGYAFNLNAGTNNQGLGGGQSAAQTYISATHVQFTTPSANVQGYNPAGPATICYWLTNPGVVEATFAFTLTPSTISGGTALAASAGMTVAGSQTIGAAVSMAATAKLTPAITGPKFSTLTDDFAVAGTPNTAKWQVVNANPAVQNVGGQLTMPLAANSFGNQSVASGIPGHIQYYDLTESYVSVQLVNAGLQDQYHSVTMYVQDATSTWQLQLNITNNVMYVASGGVTFYQGAYSSTSDQWIRFREHAGVTYFEVSADGADWKVLSTFATIPSATYLYVSLQAASFTSTGAASTVVWDNFNLGPSVTALVATSSLAAAYAAYGTVPLTATTGMSVAATVKELASVTLQGNCSLTPGGFVIEAASAHMAATAGISATGIRQPNAVVSMAPASTLTVTPGIRTAFGSVTLAVTATMALPGVAIGAKLATLQDAFATPPLDPTKWWVTGNTSQASITSGALAIGTQANVAQYTEVRAGVGADKYFDLTESYGFIQLTGAGSQSVASLEIYPIYLTDEDYNSSKNTLFWYINTGGIYAFKYVNGVQTQLAQTNYSPTAHQWLRIREHAGTTYFEYSADCIVWKSFASTSDIPDSTYLACWIQCGTYNSETVSTQTTFDNFNNAVPPYPVSFSATTSMLAAGYMVFQTATASLTVAATVKEVAPVSLAGSAALTVTGLIPKLGVVAQTGVAALTVTGARQVQGGILQAAVSAMTVIGTATETTGVAHSASAAMTVGASVRQLANVTLVGGASLNVEALTTIPMVATAALTVAGDVAKLGTVAQTATTGLTVTGTITYLSGVVLAATSHLTTTAGVREVASVSLVATAHLTVFTVDFGKVVLTGTAHLVIAGVVVRPGAVTFAARAVMVVTPGPVTRFAALNMTPTTSLSVTGFIPAFVTSSVAMVSTSSLVVAVRVTRVGVVPLVATAKLSAAGFLPATITAQVAMASQASLDVPGLNREVAAFKATAVASLLVEAMVRLAGSTVFQGFAGMRVVAESAPPSRVVMNAAASMQVTAAVERIGQPSLEDQITSITGQDPILMGATGYLDNVFTSRMAGTTD